MGEQWGGAEGETVGVRDSRHVDLAVRPLGGPQNFGAELELQALLLQDALEVLGHLHVNTHAANMAQELHCCDFRAQTLPHGALQGGRTNM